MAKLCDLKALLEAQRAAAQARRAAAPAPDHVHREPHAPVAPKRSIGATKHADGDIDLAQAFADVRRLPPRNRARLAPPSPAPLPRQRIADEEDALLASKFGTAPAPHSWDVGQEQEGEQTYVRAGIGSDVLARLRRGHWALQGELDLHGLTSEEARDRLADFLLDARARGARCVRVIHGKGLGSKNRLPVLKHKLRHWLMQREDVLAFCQARAIDGGAGAVIVLLKSASRPETRP